MDEDGVCSYGFTRDIEPRKLMYALDNNLVIPTLVCPECHTTNHYCSFCKQAVTHDDQCEETGLKNALLCFGPRAIAILIEKEEWYGVTLERAMLEIPEAFS